MKVKVIRRDVTPSGALRCDGNDTAVYIDTWEDVAVGCTCTIRGKVNQDGLKTQVKRSL